MPWDESYANLPALDDANERELAKLASVHALKHLALPPRKTLNALLWSPRSVPETQMRRSHSSQLLRVPPTLQHQRSNISATSTYSVLPHGGAGTHGSGDDRDADLASCASSPAPSAARRPLRP